jgi:hypothetical protein
MVPFLPHILFVIERLLAEEPVSIGECLKTIDELKWRAEELIGALSDQIYRGGCSPIAIVELIAPGDREVRDAHFFS